MYARTASDVFRMAKSGFRRRANPVYATFVAKRSPSELCGVAYGVHPKSRAQVKDLVDLMDHRAVRYREFRADPTASDLRPESGLPSPFDPKAIPWAAQHFPDEDFLEIVWTAARPDMLGIAQLGGDTWFYTRSGNVLALRISFLDEIAETFDLILPDRLALPALDVSSLPD